MSLVKSCARCCVAGPTWWSIAEEDLDVVERIAARLLVELGMEPTKAIASVRAVRPGAIETLDQEEFVLGICTAQD
jgi:hypothetical protein